MRDIWGALLMGAVLGFAAGRIAFESEPYRRAEREIRYTMRPETRPPMPVERREENQ